MPCTNRNSVCFMDVLWRILSLHLPDVPMCDTNSPAMMKDRRKVVQVAASVRRPPFLPMQRKYTYMHVHVYIIM